MRTTLRREVYRFPIALAELVFGLALLAIGCDSRSPNLPRFDLGGYIETMPSRPDMKFLEPEGSIRLKPREGVICRVELTLPKDGTLPVYLTPQFFDGEREGPIGELTPEAVQGRSYTFRTRMRTPSNPGLYRLKVHAVYLLKSRDSLQKLSKTEKAFQEIRFSEWGPTVEIVR
jgi:hypothetical protein